MQATTASQRVCTTPHRQFGMLLRGPRGADTVSLDAHCPRESLDFEAVWAQSIQIAENSRTVALLPWDLCWKGEGSSDAVRTVRSR